MLVETDGVLVTESLVDDDALNEEETDLDGSLAEFVGVTLGVGVNVDDALFVPSEGDRLRVADCDGWLCDTDGVVVRVVESDGDWVILPVFVAVGDAGIDVVAETVCVTEGEVESDGDSDTVCDRVGDWDRESVRDVVCEALGDSEALSDADAENVGVVVLDAE